MGRHRQRRQEYSLDSRDIDQPSQKDITAIIRAADDLIGRGGRNMVGKILKGSSAKDVLEHGHDKNPAYGHFRDLALAKIGHRVDWMIEQGYLEIHYSGRLPCLSHSEKGLAIACRLRSEEWFQQCLEMASGGGPFLMTFLKDANRRTVFQLLDRLSKEGNTNLIPLLEAWAEVDYKKVVTRIRKVIRELQGEAPRQQHTFTKCLIDESVSQAGYALFQTWAKEKGYFWDQTSWIIEEAPGIQDKHILDRLLDSNTCLLTSDRVLHNVTLAKPHASFCLSEDGVVSTTSIKGFKP